MKRTAGRACRKYDGPKRLKRVRDDQAAWDLRNRSSRKQAHCRIPSVAF
jgi:hypothetical protein